MSSIWPSEHCCLYLPGHLVHWIQAFHSHDEPRTPRVGRVVPSDGGVIVVDLDGEMRAYRNHATRRVAELVARLGPIVTVDEGWSILKLSDGDAQLCFSIAPGEKPWTPCRPAEDVRTAAAHTPGECVLRDGGARFPGRLVLRDPED